jgi:type III secretion system low calcium response chaperone LcrH/SycD
MPTESIHQTDLNALEWILQSLQEENPFGKAATGDQIREMHAIAYFLYGQRRYLDASHHFRLLCTARPGESKYWKGLGACFQMLKEYQEALNCYAAAQLINEKNTDPYLYLHAADCYIGLNETKLALKALKAARKRGLAVKDQRVLEHVKIMQDIWSKS